MIFAHDTDIVLVTDTLEMEFRMKRISGSNIDPVRQPAGLVYYSKPDSGNVLYIGKDSIFIWSDYEVIGDLAEVDTDDDFHNYRVEVDNAGNINVFYDDILTLTGQTINSNVPVGMVGLTINSPNNTIEGLEIRDCIDYGILLEGQSCKNNLIINNTITLNRLCGIYLKDSASSNQIGGYSADEANVLNQNGHGLGINLDADSNRIIGNQIGPTAFLDRNGIEMFASSYNLIDSNTIFENGKGINVSFFSLYNTITRNQIYLNDSLGIDLDDDGVTANDPGDSDFGSNDLLNFPEIDSVFMDPDSSFTVTGTAAGNARVEFFVAHPAGDSTRPENFSGHGEAYSYLGFTICDINGDFIGIIPKEAGQFSKITMTATDTLGNTSELSENFTLIPATLIIVGYSTPNSISLTVTDPEGYYIGRDTNDILSQTLFPATYTEGANDSIYINYPKPGLYTISVISETGASMRTTYGVGIRIDGSNENMAVVDRDLPPSGESDEYDYEVEENWHYINGDANRDSTLNIFDITFIITYLYLEGEAPWPVNSADANCDLVVNIFDITHLITYLYLGGEEPCYLEE